MGRTVGVAGSTVGSRRRARAASFSASRLAPDFVNTASCTHLKFCHCVDPVGPFKPGPQWISIQDPFERIWSLGFGEGGVKGRVTMRAKPSPSSARASRLLAARLARAAYDLPTCVDGVNMLLTELRGTLQQHGVPPGRSSTAQG